MAEIYSIQTNSSPFTQAQKQKKSTLSFFSSKSRTFTNILLLNIFLITLIFSMLVFVYIPYTNNTSNQHIENTKLFNNREQRYDWAQPSYSLMSKFRHAAITCDHGLCSEIGRDVMLNGGNAIDAAIASMFCLGVTNPQSSGIGGGFIMTMYNRTTKMCKVIDARETAPAASKFDMYGNDEWASKYGYKAIAVPGEIAGYWLAFKNFGSGNVFWSRLVMPSVLLARNGVPVSEYLAHVLNIKEKHIKTLPSMSEWLDPKTNKVYQFGDIIKRTKLANTLEKIAHSSDPVELFYRGEMADIIIKEIQENGGILTKKDLMLYTPKVYDSPLISELPIGEVDNKNELKLCGPPPPSSFAVTQSIIAAMVARFSNHEREGNIFNKTTLLSDTEFYHWFIEIQKFAYAQRARLGDIDFSPNSLKLAQNMTNSLYIKDILNKVPKKAQPQNYYSNDETYQKEDHGTSHSSVIDEHGNGVSVTTTVNRWFGAVVESTELGIIWNDEMDDFSTPGMNNGFGFSPSKENYIEPGKRPMSSMSPMVIFNTTSGNLKFIIGASGGSKIISAVAKPIIRVICFNETIKEGIDAPILHNQFTPFETQFEESIPQNLLKDLEHKFGQNFKKSSGFEGIVQGIQVSDDGYIYANGDFRRRTNMHPEGF